MEILQKKPNYSTRFQKGNKAAAGPRKQTIKRIQAQQEALNAIFAEAKGHPILIQQLMLQRGAELELDVATTIRLCDKLAPYLEAKKASLDVKHEVIPAFNIVENRVEQGILPGSVPAIEKLITEEES